MSDAVQYPNGSVEWADRYVNLEFRGENRYEFGTERHIDCNLIPSHMNSLRERVYVERMVELGSQTSLTLKPYSKVFPIYK